MNAFHCCADSIFTCAPAPLFNNPKIHKENVYQSYQSLSYNNPGTILVRAKFCGWYLSDKCNDSVALNTYCLNLSITGEDPNSNISKPNWNIFFKFFLIIHQMLKCFTSRRCRVWMQFGAFLCRVYMLSQFLCGFFQVLQQPSTVQKHALGWVNW